MTRTRIALLTLGDPARVTGGYLFHRRLADRAAEHGARIEFVSVPDLPLPWALLTGPAWLRHRALIDADALVLDSIAAAPAAPWLGRLATPVVGMLHQPIGGMDAGDLRRAVRAPFDRWAYRRADRLLVASEWLAEQLVASGIPRGRLRVVPPGKDPAPELAEPDTEAPGDLRRSRHMAVLCVANWLPRKGILELLEALARIPDDLVTLHLVGDEAMPGTYPRRIRRFLEEPDLRDRVVIHGVVPAASVARMYRQADAFALPSFEEPYGTVWGEAMEAGLSVIGWRAGNLPFLADHGREGMLAPVGDIDGLARMLETLARDPDLRLAMGRAARERAAERPTWDETADLFFTAVAEVLQARRAPVPVAGR